MVSTAARHTLWVSLPLLIVLAALFPGCARNAAQPPSPPPQISDGPSTEGIRATPSPNPLADVDPSMIQIAIEALIVEVNESRSREIGMDYALDVKELGKIAIQNITGARIPGIGASFTDISVGNLGTIAAELRLLLDSGDAAVRTRPVAVALNGTEVEIETVNEVPYQDVAFDQGNTMLRVAWEKVGVRLKVLPRLLVDDPERRIELDIQELKVSSVSNFINIRDVSRPVFQTSNATTKVLLHDAETLVIGGLKSKRKITRENRVPYLGQIPLVGSFFKYQEQKTENTDIVFYITPHVLTPGVNPILPFDFSNTDLAKARTTGFFR
jgi:type II secretory pathway component GspD/PulD (secretin)